jgi:hypothetical protein
LVAAGCALLAYPAAAQIKFGEVSTNASGTISSGYTANYGNLTGSTHSWTAGGAASFSGSFHSPNFLSFNVSPYLNQSRANSNFQSISNASGVNATATIFGGSHFPGSVSYSKAYNSEGNYAVPGLADYVTHGNSDTFGINWSENLPDRPSFSAGYQMGNSSYSVYGTSSDGNNAFHSLNLHSGYRWEGFNTGAYYTRGGAHSLIPESVSGFAVTETHSDNSAYGVNVSHLLPMRGSASAGVNHSTWNSNYLGSDTSGTVDTVNALAAIHPRDTLSLSVTANYSDNLSGQLYQAVIAAGGVIPGLNSNQSSNSLDLMGVASYTPLPNLQTSAFFERRSQSFLGEDYGVKSYGGGATYARAMLRGSFNGAVTVAANSSENSGADTLSFSTNENYSAEFDGWHVTGSFGYAQNAQTLVVTYLNSFYNFSGNIRRNWGHFNVSAGAGGARTALTQQAGTTSSSQNYSASVGFGPWLTSTGSYSKSSGQAILTGGGLVPVPVPSPTLPSNLISLFGGDSYSVGVSSSPLKKLILAASYAKSNSNTTSGTNSSSNQNNQLNVLTQYQYRKLNFISGYSRLEQGFSNSGTQPEILSSYYFGLSRWFNFF